MASPRKTGIRIFFTLVVLALIGGGVYYLFFRNNDKPPEITTAPIKRGSIIQSISATGLLQAPISVDVSSQVSGNITEVHVDFNDRVKKDDVLARLDPSTYQSKLAQSQAQLLQSQAQFENTQASATLTRLTTERSRELYKQNLVSKADLDAAEAQLQQAEAQIAQANAQVQIQQANVASAQTDLTRCTIYAPLDGIVLDRETDPGRTVAASLNAPTLFTIIPDLTKMQISTDVSEADIGNVAVGQDVTFTVDAYPGRPFAGKVVQIRNMPKTSQSVVVYSTMINVDNADEKLKPGMTANVSIIIARHDNILSIPNSALRIRVPDKYAPPAPATGATGANGGGASANGGAGAGKSKSGKGGGGDNYAQISALMQEAGITRTRGQSVPPDAIEKLKQLATERGVTIPDQFLERLSGGRNNAGAASQVTTRTVYLETSPWPNLKLEARVVHCGITDGTNTEILGGLAEGDTVITSIYVAGATVTAAPSSSPFSTGSRYGR